MITTDIAHGNFIVFTDDIIKGFSDPVWVDIKGIDPSLYFEAGKCYVQSSCMTFIHQAEINIVTGKLLSEPEIISTGCGGRDVEAPHVYRIGGWYYLMCAEGGTRDGHMATVQRSRFLYGPYEKSPYTPMVSNRDKSKEKLQSVGHADLIQDNDGNWWIVALAVRSHKHKHHLGRETILLPVEWSQDGWPTVKDGYAPSQVKCPDLEIETQKDESFRDDFDKVILDQKFNSIRDFLVDNYSLKEKPGYLILTGNGKDLNTLDSPIFIGTRQKEFNCVFETSMHAELEQNSTAGLAILIDNLHHMEVGLSNSDGVLEIYTKKTVDDIVIKKAFKAWSNEITIGIEADAVNYKFYYVNNL